MPTAYISDWDHAVSLPEGYVAAHGKVKAGDLICTKKDGAVVWLPSHNRVGLSVGKFCLVIRPKGGER